MTNLIDNILAWIERTSSTINSWAWDKRWKDKDHLRHIGTRTGKIYTINKKTGERK